MQRLEVSGAVRPIYGSLGVKRLSLAVYEEQYPTPFERDTVIHSLGDRVDPKDGLDNSENVPLSLRVIESQTFHSVA